MNQMVTRARKDRIRKQRHTLKKKRIVATLEIILFTSLLATAVYFFVETTKAKAVVEKYTVQKGDTLFSISNQYQIDIEDIQKANKLNSNTIIIGQKLIIPDQSSSSYHVVKKGETVYSIAKIYGLPITTLKKQNKLKSNTIFIGQVLTVPKVNNSIQSQETDDMKQSNLIHDAEMGISEFYTVVHGDTLWSLSSRFGVPFTKLKRENSLSANHIQVGQKLFISGKKHFATGKVVGAADNTTVEFYVYGEALPLEVSHGAAVLFQKMVGKELFITYKNGALISYY